MGRCEQQGTIHAVEVSSKFLRNRFLQIGQRQTNSNDRHYQHLTSSRVTLTFVEEAPVVAGLSLVVEVVHAEPQVGCRETSLSEVLPHHEGEEPTGRGREPIECRSGRTKRCTICKKKNEFRHDDGKNFGTDSSTIPRDSRATRECREYAYVC